LVFRRFGSALGKEQLLLRIALIILKNTATNAVIDLVQNEYNPVISYIIFPIFR
jgi:hypothetical protein